MKTVVKCFFFFVRSLQDCRFSPTVDRREISQGVNSTCGGPLISPVTVLAISLFVALSTRLDNTTLPGNGPNARNEKSN